MEIEHEGSNHEQYTNCLSEVSADVVIGDPQSKDLIRKLHSSQLFKPEIYQVSGIQLAIMPRYSYRIYDLAVAHSWAGDRG